MTATIVITVTVDRDELDSDVEGTLGPALDEAVYQIAESTDDAGPLDLAGRGIVGQWEIK